jgi:glutathione S-transferase
MHGDPQVYRVPHSTNVERVALALAHKRRRVTWVDVDPVDRSVVEELSGQGLVPVLQTPDGSVIPDSMAIVAWLERETPEQALWPADPAGRAQTDIFIEWFNGVWKLPPNAIARERGRLVPDAALIVEWTADLRGWLTWFEGLLQGRDFLLGDRLGAADICAFPFLKFGVLAPPADDDDPFHAVLRETLPIASTYPRLEAWVLRVDALPRA